ncbi:ABC transporter ATP-binding protein [Neobacillus sp. YIM B06451]|uniref:ABC transporter ATP-binding protein n=1 Tax=Neobacillus sp. YIM B06451 TaxID=3070994 RepID=UPI00292EF94C|nr:ABC transporter ATP-binding protein [Neobacillus sp. YIM B06451]
MKNKVLEVKDLQIDIMKDKQPTSVVNNISFHVFEGETLGVVGESGCGKSLTSLSIMRLLASPPVQVGNGEILFNGEDLLKLDGEKMRGIRGNQISMIFQEPMTSLNPVFTIGKQIDEVLLIHEPISKKLAKQRSIEMLTMVGIPRAEQIYSSYPYQLSGGMRQRVMIAIALACKPKLLIADEPTTALDVTIQAQILDLMKKLKEETNNSIMFITHDLGVVAEMCDRVIVMYSGEIVEESDVDSLFNDPKHPYTIGLLSSTPNIKEKSTRLFSIKGQVPTPGSVKEGCPFASRCRVVMEKCLTVNPPLIDVGENHKSRCWLNVN